MIENIIGTIAIILIMRRVIVLPVGGFAVFV